MYRKVNSTLLSAIAVIVFFTRVPYCDVFETPDNPAGHFIGAQQEHPWFRNQGLERPVNGAMNIVVECSYSPIAERNYPRPSNLCQGINDRLGLVCKFLNLTGESYRQGTNHET